MYHSILNLLSRFKNEAGQAVRLIDLLIAHRRDNLDRLRILVRNETDPVLVIVERDSTLRSADDFDRHGRPVSEVELQGKIVAFLLLRSCGEFGIIRHVMERACDSGIADNDVILQRADGLSEKSSLAAFRRNGEA